MTGCAIFGIRTEQQAMSKCYEQRLPIRTYDIDFAGIVSNIVFIRWLEDLRLGLMAKAYPLLQALAEDVAPVLLETRISYRRPVTIRDPLIGRMRVAELGRVRWRPAARSRSRPRSGSGTAGDADPAADGAGARRSAEGGGRGRGSGRRRAGRRARGNPGGRPQPGRSRPRSDRACGNAGIAPGRRPARRAPAGRLRSLCDARTLCDVRRRDRPRPLAPALFRRL